MESTTTVWSSKIVKQTIDKLRLGLPCDMSCFHLRDPELKASNILFQYTAEEQLEFERCSKDIVYFVENYCRFLNDKGRTTVQLRQYQREILNTIGEENWVDEIEDFGPKNRNVIICASRQIGKCLSINALSIVRKMKDQTTSSHVLSLLYYYNKEHLTLLEKIKVKLICFYINLN